MSEEPTAVIEEPATQEATPAARWEALERDIAAATSRLAELTQQAATGNVSLDDTLEQLGIERWLTNVQPHREALHRAMVYHQASIDAVGIKSAHDEKIEAKRACHERIAAAYTELFAAFKTLAVVHDQQIAPLQRLTRPGTAEPAIPTRSGAEVARDVASSMPGAMGLHMVLFEPTSRALTNGDLARMMDADPGLRELNPRILERYLAGLRA